MWRRERFSCPTRPADEMFEKDNFNRDRWTRRGVCSCCGSVKPDRLVEMLRAGLAVVPDEIGRHDVLIHDPAGMLAGRVDYRHLKADHIDEIREMIRQQKLKMGQGDLGHWH